MSGGGINDVWVKKLYFADRNRITILCFSSDKGILTGRKGYLDKVVRTNERCVILGR